MRARLDARLDDSPEAPHDRGLAWRHNVHAGDEIAREGKADEPPQDPIPFEMAEGGAQIRQRRHAIADQDT